MARQKKIKRPDRTDFERHLLEGKCLIGQGRYAESVDELYKASINQDENKRDIDVIYHLGYAHYKNGDKSEALGVLMGLQEIAPDDRRTKKLEKMLGRRR